MTDLLIADRNERIWYLRHQAKWSVPRIARRMNLTERTIRMLLRRMARSRGLIKKRRPPKQRYIRMVSLSQVFDI